MSVESLEKLMNRIRAFQESRALLTAVELDLFSAVGQGATAAEVARRLQTDERASEMLMNALVALGMLQKKKGVFRNTRLAAVKVLKKYHARGEPHPRLGKSNSEALNPPGVIVTASVRSHGGDLPA